MVSLKLLGPFWIEAENGTAVSLRRKSRAVLAYLAAAERPYTRHELASLFCQSAADPNQTLRLILSRLRRVVGEATLLTEGDMVHLDSELCPVDLHLFAQTLHQSDLSQVSSDALAQVVALYRGEFLEGLHLPDASEFEMWLVGQRSRWRQLYERGALAWLRRLIAGEQLSAALPVAQKLVQHNPLLEDAHYQLIWLYAQTNQRAAAIAQFEHCQTILQEELAVAPSPELAGLYENIQAGGQSRRVTVSPQTVPAWPTTADFVGREAEMQQLQATWQVVQKGHSRTLLITAEAGGGKTRLVQEWAGSLPAGAYFYAACHESTHALAYHPWITLLEQWLARLDTAVLETLPTPFLDALSRLLPTLAHQPSAAVDEQTRLFAAVLALLRLGKRPFTLFIDDWQWADAASLQLLHFLVERGISGLIIGTIRGEEAEDNPALLTLLQDWSRRDDIPQLALSPLSADTEAG